MEEVNVIMEIATGKHERSSSRTLSKTDENENWGGCLDKENSQR